VAICYSYHHFKQQYQPQYQPMRLTASGIVARNLFRTFKMFAALSRNAAADEGIRSSRSFAEANASLNAA
jgi:hypothetical protein